MPVARHGEPSEGARMCADEMRDLVKCALFGVRSFLIHANGSVIVLIPALFLTSSVVVASDHIALCAQSVYSEDRLALPVFHPFRFIQRDEMSRSLPHEQRVGNCPYKPCLLHALEMIR